MPITGVYFIPSHPNSTTALPTITEHLRSTFPDTDLIPVSRWALEHKLMRDTPGLLPSAQRTQKPRYMQFLSLTHYPTHGFIYTSEPAEKPFHPPNAAASTAAPPVPPATGVAVGAGGGVGGGVTIPPQPQPTSTPMSTTPSQTGPAPQPTTTPANDLPPMQMTAVPPPSYGTLFHHVTYACQPFWCHRMTVAVPAGVVYDVGEFRVRLGDVRQTFPTGRVRGTVVEIEWRGPSVVDSVAALVGGRGLSGSGPGLAAGYGAGAGGAEQDSDSGIDVSCEIEEADVEAEYVATASLIRGFWARLGVEGGREAILVPGVGKEVKERLVRLRGQKGEKKGREVVRDEVDPGPGVGISGFDDDPDPLAGVDLARQYMEVLRFNR